jgi:tetratricopeptide (TPR) repeat protein
MVARATRLLLGFAAAAALGGCGDPDLWERYRAEQAFWRARRLAEGVQLNPQVATNASYDRAIAAFRDIANRYPAARWAGVGRSSISREVAAVAGRAEIACARLEEMRGRDAVALEGYARARRDCSPLVAVALEAALARAGLLARASRDSEALGAWVDISREFPLVDPERPAALQPVLDAPLHVAAALALAGRTAARDSVLDAAERRLRDALERASGGASAPELWLSLAAVREARGNLDGALEALRRTLAEPADREHVPQRVLALARVSLEGGRPDSARSYAAWAERGFGGQVRAEGMRLVARAWEAARAPDSALAAYARLLEAYPKEQDSVADARFRRGVILEAEGVWELARSEYSALIAALPTHPQAFEAALRVVRHHARRGEAELARTEARHALDRMNDLIATQHDDTVQQWARRTRAELLIATGNAAGACDALAELWRRYPGTPLGTDAGLKAAGIAEAELGNRERAAELYRELSVGARDPESRKRAQAALERLASGRG